MIVQNKILEAKNTLLEKESGFVQELQYVAQKQQLLGKVTHNFTTFHSIIISERTGEHSTFTWGVKKRGFLGIFGGAKLFSVRIFEDNHQSKPKWTVTTTIHDEEYRDLIESHIEEFIHDHLRTIFKPHGKYIEKMN